MECPYDLKRVIGTGGCARVYLGVHRDSGVRAAVKVCSTPLATERMRREIDTLSQIDHPNVMPLMEADPAGRWYAMPIAEFTLRDLHDRDPGAWDEVRRALRQVCAALAYLHPRGFVHRDISPMNVLRLADGRWVLSDFGLVKRTRGRSTSLTVVGARFGTRDFSAPEVHHDPRTVTPAADVYSIGALARWFTSVTGEQVPTSEWGVFWQKMVVGTYLLRPERRWDLDQVIDHLERAPVAVLVAGHSALDACARCGSRDGIGPSERCLRCGFLDEA